MTDDFSVLVAFITYICFPIIYVMARPLWKIVISYRSQETSVFSKLTLTKKYILENIEIRFTFSTNKQLQYVVGCV